MIPSINSVSRIGYVPSFGILPSDNYKKKKSEKNFQNPKAQLPQLPPTDFMANKLINDFLADRKEIKNLENEVLKSNPVNHDSLVPEIKKGIQEENLFADPLNLFVFMLNGQPYTGYAKENTTDPRRNGTAVYMKFQNGKMINTFMKNPQKDFSGYTNIENMTAKYYISTPNQKTLLSSKHANGKTVVKIATMHNNVLYNRIYTIYDKVNTQEEYDINFTRMQKLIADVNECFGNLLNGDFYFI